MKNLQRYLQQVADARRKELIPYVYAQTSGIVQTGPFRGMCITPKTMWGDGDTVSKLLGLYENELHSYLEQAVIANPDIVVNIGCAEGYYSIGLAQRLPKSTVLAVDMDARSKPIINDNATANNVKNVSALTHCVDVAWLQDCCEKQLNPLLVFDCEGAELELLDPGKVTALSKCSVLVECHDCIIPGITETLIKRFEDTHNIELTSQTVKDAYQFEFLKTLSDCDKWALVHEGRPSAMTWLYMVPKK
jgi:ribosomal protein L11 methylase PrmA